VLEGSGCMEGDRKKCLSNEEKKPGQIEGQGFLKALLADLPLALN
jgi:hypothetical protein